MERTLLFGVGRDLREVIRVSASGEVHVAAVVEEAAQRCGAELRGDLAVWHVPHGEGPTPLDPGAAFASVATRSGDAIVVMDPSVRPAPPTPHGPSAGVLALVVVGGARCGLRTPLCPGRNTAAGYVLDVAPDRSVTVLPHGDGPRPRIDGRPVPSSGALLAPGAWLQCGPEVVTVRLPDGPGPAASTGTDRAPRSRAPHVGAPVSAAPYPLPDVPGGPARSGVPLGAVLAPAVLAVVAAAIMANPIYLLFGALSPLVGAWRIGTDRRRGRHRYRVEVREFHAALARAEADLAEIHGAALQARRARTPDVDALARRALRGRSTLWERRRDDRDFLEVRVGVGNLPALLEVTAGAEAHSSPEELIAEARALQADHTLDRCVPVGVDLGRDGGVVLGIAGPREVADGLAAAVALQVVVLHPPEDVELVVVHDVDAAGAWEWTRWLPHSSRWPAAVPAAELAEHLDQATRGHLSGRGTGPGARRHLVVVVPSGGDSARAGLLTRAAGHGVSFIWCAAARDRLPDRCDDVLVADSAASGRLVRLGSPGAPAVDLLPDAGGAVDLVAVARSLAGHGDEVDGSVRAVPGRVGLCETLAAFHGEDPAAPAAIRRMWARPRPLPLRAVIGAGAGALVSVDLDADGPHALVVGTTGSGKSELFSTVLASLAVSTPASRLAFLLVDFKGGAAFDRLAALPHTAGVVTDLDGPLAQRVLVSMQAELRRRMEVLRGLGVGDLAACERSRPDAAPPRLIVVVDEFAALARDVPGFVDGLVDVARRGRSLGVHLFVGTQQPDAGTAKLRDNTNLRICMRVQDAQVSRDVVGTAAAAEIPRGVHGRAIVVRGHGETAEVQTAWGGTRAGGAARASVDVVRSTAGRRGPGVEEGVPEEAEGTELEAVVAAVCAAWSTVGPHDAHPHRVWIPPPAGVIALDGLEVGTPVAPVVGVADDPHLQRIAPMAIDLAEHASVLVGGRSGSGRTTLLRTFAAALARAGTPAEVSFYALDYGNGGLGGLAMLPHCPALIAAGEDERVDRLFAVLTAEMTRWSADPTRRLPEVVLLIDGYGAFVAAHDDWAGGLVATLGRICDEGRGLGMHVVAAGDPAAVPARMQNGFGAVVELTGPGDALGPAGRTWRVATATDLGAGPGHVPPSPLPPVDALPAVVSLAEVDSAGTDAARHLTVPLGIDVESREVARCDLAQVPLFLVAGPMRSGRSTALATLASGITSARRVLLAPRRGWLPELGCWDEVSVGAHACAAAAESLAAELRARLCGAASGDEVPLAVFVDDAESLAEGPAATALEEVGRRCWDAGLHLIAAAEAHAAARSYGWLMQLRVGRHGLILQADRDLDSEIFRLRLPRRRPGPLRPGRGELVAGGEVSQIQVAWSNEG